MKSKSDDKVVEQPGSERPVRTVLRLVPRGDREQHETEPGAARKIVPNREVRRPAWDGDDDDPGPAAA